MNGQRRLTILSEPAQPEQKSRRLKAPSAASMSHLHRLRTLDQRLVTAGVALLLAALVWVLPNGALAEREHTVGRGQTLARIAAKYGIAVSALAAANGITDREQLREGQVLLVPPRGVVYVGAGDTLAGLA